MSKGSSRNRTMAINRKQKRKGKLRKLRNALLVATGKKKEDVIAKIGRVAPYASVEESNK